MEMHGRGSAGRSYLGVVPAGPLLQDHDEGDDQRDFSHHQSLSGDERDLGERHLHHHRLHHAQHHHHPAHALLAALADLVAPACGGDRSYP